MNKKTYIIIGIVVVILVVAICVGGFFLKENKEKDASVGTDWGDIYYDYLGNKFEKDLPGVGELNEYEVQFVPREDDYPIMTVRFSRK